MEHNIAKLILEHATSFVDRSEAIRTALGMGMPLNKIEEYLDWLDAVRGPVQGDTGAGQPSPDSGAGNVGPPPASEGTTPVERPRSESGSTNVGNPSAADAADMEPQGGSSPDR